MIWWRSFHGDWALIAGNTLLNKYSLYDRCVDVTSANSSLTMFLLLRFASGGQAVHTEDDVSDCIGTTSVST
jgi:hypothetical protein